MDFVYVNRGTGERYKSESEAMTAHYAGECVDIYFWNDAYKELVWFDELDA